MKRLYILLYVVGLLSLSSCSGFLDVKPTNQADASQSITSPTDANVMLNGLYNTMTTSSFYGRNFILYGDAKSGDLTIQSNGRGYDYMFAYKHAANNYSMSGFWTTGYNIIMNANNIIEGIEALGLGEDYHNYYGQALAIRAMAHYDLCRLYGKCYNDDKTAWGVPIVLETLESSAQPLRETVEAVYNAVIEDLNSAKNYIDKDNGTGKMNYYTVLALRSRVAMDMQDYSTALTLAEEIINSGEFKLYGLDEWVESWETQGGSESIFELAMCPNEGDLGSTSCIGAQYVLGGGNGRNNQIFMASHYWLDLMNEDQTDVRWGIMDIDQVEEAHPGDYTQYPGGKRLGSCWKYFGNLSGTGDGKATSSAVNVKLIRLSEIYLIAAEAAIMASTPDKTKAAKYLNEIITRRSPGIAKIDEANVTQKRILDEKDKEFFGEGLRYWDLIRTNSTIYMDDDTPDVKVTDRESVINRSFYKCILPIYTQEMNANPGIAKQQNPGY